MLLLLLALQIVLWRTMDSPNNTPIAAALILVIEFRVLSRSPTLLSTMSLLPILSLLICISVHACNGRYLSHVFGRETVVYAKDKDEVVSNPSISSENIATQKSIEIESQGLKVVKKDFSSRGILFGASSKEKMASLYDREERTTGTASGTKAVVPRYSPDDMQQASGMKESKFRVRSMLVFTRSDVEEATESKENETAEDLVETDYAQPHRKPPIHNERS